MLSSSLREEEDTLAAQIAADALRVIVAPLLAVMRFIEVRLEKIELTGVVAHEGLSIDIWGEEAAAPARGDRELTEHDDIPGEQ